jgi:hypothetical protein
MSKKYDTFISYSSKESVIATEICNYLESNGVSCWIAPRDIRPGYNYGSEIVLAIKACKIFVLVFTDNANRSDHVANEVDRAFNNKKIIIPFKTEEFELSSTFEYYLSKTHWIAAMPNRNDYYSELLRKCLSEMDESGNTAKENSQENKSELLSATKNDKNRIPESGENCFAGEEEVIKVVGNHAPPARIFDGETATGFYFDIMRAIGLDQDINLQFIRASFDMSFKMLKMGKAHVMIGPNKTHDRLKNFIYSDIALKSAKKVFYVNVNAAPILEYEDLFGFILITMKNTFYSKEIATDTNLTKVEITNYKTGIDMVNKSERYVIVMPEKQGDYLLEELDIDLIKSPFFLEGQSSYIIFSKQTSKSVITAIEKGLKNIMDNNTYYNILDMY